MASARGGCGGGPLPVAPRLPASARRLLVEQAPASAAGVAGRSELGLVMVEGGVDGGEKVLDLGQGVHCGSPGGGRRAALSPPGVVG